ncbi:hypothetical protein B0T26DRAFT_748041 [Lasiosphaeria miniovina]|uniref:Uncharacterized protein n=1 Tax=Lasiosphaeria miniovina TaxID=1954250 RepID=A0AA40B4Z8_9PEZI|nr:uncharacterized protein B0T26DRAFT_748041 [Lasiosphaeria miniovina]KAK0727737.1 hypothetical protein B0T26DRAFT_748041 [Lasiosphaeria miniovina]
MPNSIPPEIICSETYPKAEPVELFRRAARSKAFLGQIAADKPDSPVPRPASLQPLPTNPYHLWYELVGIYSRGGLTKTTDKLIALSGIAREILPHLGGKTPETTERKNQPVCPSPGEPYQAPSWSRVSVHCPVAVDYQLHSTPHDALATVEEAQATPKLGPFGGVRPGAHLRIKGTVYKAQFRYSHFSGRGWPELTIGTKRISSKFKGSFAILPDDLFADDAHTRQRYRHVRLLPILQSKQKGTFSRQSPGSWAWLVMLMLVPMTDKPGECRRFGLLELKGNGSDTGKRVCDPLHGTFTII